MSRALVDVILTDHDHAWLRVSRAIEGLTNAEYRWQPVPGAYTLRDIWPQPESGVSTIEWKLAHFAGWKMRFANFLFGGSRTPSMRSSRAIRCQKSSPTWSGRGR